MKIWDKIPIPQVDLRIHLWYKKLYVENTEFLTHLAEKSNDTWLNSNNKKL